MNRQLALMMSFACQLGLTRSACSAGDCPSISGQWTIVSHCEASYVGQDFKISMKTTPLGEEPTCNFETRIAGGFFEGHIWPDQVVSMEGRADGTQIGCHGSGDGNALSLTCTGDCPVELRRGEGGTASPTNPRVANCPDIGGSWAFVQQCAPEDDYFEPGEATTIIQTGCDIWFTDASGINWRGAISSSGQVSVDTSVGTLDLDCAGSLQGDRLDLSCDPNLCGGFPSKIILQRNLKQASGR